MSTAIAPPTWDMSVIFPSLESKEFITAFEDARQNVAATVRFFDTHQIQGSGSKNVSSSVAAEAISRLNALYEETETIEAYIYGFVTTDASDNLAQAKLGEAMPLMAELAKLYTRLSCWIGENDFSEAPELAEHKFFVTKAVAIAQHSMAPNAEELAADMTNTGANAWSRLHGDVTSQLMVPLHGQDEPMPVIRNYAYDEDRNKRRDAYQAELNAWRTVDVVCAAAMNGIKGEVNLLSSKRGWDHPLDESLFLANMDRATLDAMLGAAADSFPMMRRYMKAKAKHISGGNALAWYDLFAPIGSESREWNFEQGANFVIEQFGTYSPKMAQFAQRAVDENWIDALPRPGKRDGAFCMGIRKDESRILQTWKPSFGAVSTLAHELGHGYHNLCLYGKSPIQKLTPMTLAETASIFCEQIIGHAAIQTASGGEKLNLLDNSLQRSSQTVVDISSRFRFEHEVFARRKKTTLSADELCEVMLDSQQQTYGDGLSDERHAYMWAVKPHYYSTYSYYNFPYMFGLLFSMSLFAIYQEDPDTFRAKYDDLLASTALDNAAALAARFGIDITKKAFWEGSLKVIEQEVNEFEAIIG